MTREQAIEHGKSQLEVFSGEHGEFIKLAIKALEQEPTSFQWCTDCKEYDQEKHCCYRWSKVIRDTVEEMKQEQEPILDKIRAEIRALSNANPSYWHSGDMVDRDDVLAILDKYKTESEEI